MVFYMYTRNCVRKRPSLRLSPSSYNFLKNALPVAMASFATDSHALLRGIFQTLDEQNV